MNRLPDYVVTNFHKRYTGVSATIKHLIPRQQNDKNIAVIDTGHLKLEHTWALSKVILKGWTKPRHHPYRILHVRRDIEILFGLFLKYILMQPWQIIFTNATAKKHGRFLTWLIQSCDAIIATSKRSAPFLNWHSVIIHHGVDTDFYSPNSASINEDHTLWLGTFGRLRAFKGSDLFVKALIELLPQHPQWSAFLAGLAKDKAYLNWLKQMVADAGLSERILFLGHLNHTETLKYYQKCRLVAACSRREGFGLTPLEAMATGVPVITSGAGFWPELIDPKLNGRMFKTGDLNDLIAVMDSMLKQPDHLLALGQTARQYVIEHHHISIEAQKINEFYDQVAHYDKLSYLR